MTLDDDDLVLLLAALEALNKTAAPPPVSQYVGFKCADLSKRLMQYREDRRNNDA